MTFDCCADEGTRKTVVWTGMAILMVSIFVGTIINECWKSWKLKSRTEKTYSKRKMAEIALAGCGYLALGTVMHIVVHFIVKYW